MIDLTTLSADDLDALARALSRERMRREAALDAPADADLFSHAHVSSRLEDRATSDDDVAGDLLMRAFGWRRGEAGGGLVSRSGRTVEIRARRVGSLAAAGTFATLRTTAEFDMLACVALAPDFSVLRAVLLERDAFISRATPGRARGTLDLALGDAVRLGHGAYDVTAALAAAQGGRSMRAGAVLADAGAAGDGSDRTASAAAAVGGSAAAAAVGGSAAVAGDGPARTAPARLQRRRRRRTGTSSASRAPSLRAQLAASLALASRMAEPEGS